MTLRANLPGITVDFIDGRLGLVPASGASVHAKIGVAPRGTGVLTPVSTQAQVADSFGAGPLAGALAVALVEAQPIYAYALPGDVAGSAGAVTQTGSGPALTVTGTPGDAYGLAVTVTRGGAPGTAALRVTVNGTDGPEVALPGNGEYPLPDLGLTLKFGAGALSQGTTYAFITAAPAMTLGALIPALEALLADGRPFRFVHIVGAATPAVAAAVETVLESAETRTRYTGAILEAEGPQNGESEAAWMARLNEAWKGFVSPHGRVTVCAGERSVYNPLTRRFEARNIAWLFTPRRASRPISESSTRVRTGPLRPGGTLSHDEYAAPGLNVARFVTLRTYPGLTGTYITDAPTMADATSDFSRLERREVLDEVARVAYILALQYAGEGLDVDKVTGQITEAEAQQFETHVRAGTEAQLAGDVSAIAVTADRTVNILTTETLKFEVGCVPLSYSKYLTMQVGFVNPMLRQQQAVQAPTTAAPA